jgi:hypothetical protein|tara:strand:+ start:347 stop:478 length:132 start_codon:yes stop_codon:yes gene_type:complete
MAGPKQKNKLTPRNKKLAKMYGDPKKVTRGDIIKAAQKKTLVG